MVINKISEGYKILTNEGGFSFILALVGYTYRKSIRNFMPVKGYTEFQGVKVTNDVMPMIRLFDQKLPKRWHRGLNKGNSSKPETKAIELFVEEGDTVLIIGAGWGVSTVVAARHVKPNGRVIIYEGSDKYLEYAKKTIKLNDMVEICDIRHGVIGFDKGVYDGKMGESIQPSELPECDVLQLDCEGCEYSVLKNLNIRPRIISVEIHPEHGNYPYQHIIDELHNMNYSIIRCFTQEGEEITANELKNKSQNASESPPLAVAKYNSND